MTDFEIETTHYRTKQTEQKSNSCIITIDEKALLLNNKSEESTDSDRGVAPHRDFYDLSKLESPLEEEAG